MAVMGNQSPNLILGSSTSTTSPNKRRSFHNDNEQIMKPQRATSVATWGSRFSIGPSRATPATPARLGRHFQIGGPVQRWHRCNGDPAPVHLLIRDARQHGKPTRAVCSLSDV